MAWRTPDNVISANLNERLALALCRTAARSHEKHLPVATRLEENCQIVMCVRVRWDMLQTPLIAALSVIDASLLR